VKSYKRKTTVRATASAKALIMAGFEIGRDVDIDDIHVVSVTVDATHI
jgi:hypothetical protein